MKNFKHSVLALSMVALLSACGAKEISYNEAKERTLHYNQEIVVRQYSATKITTVIEIQEATGVFSPKGILSEMVPEAGTETRTVNEVSIVSGFPSEEEAKDVKFYANGTYGLKMVVAEELEHESVKGLEGKITSETSINDLGLAEFSNLSFHASIAVTESGLQLEGVARYTIKTTFEYIPAVNA